MYIYDGSRICGSLPLPGRRKFHPRGHLSKDVEEAGIRLRPVRFKDALYRRAIDGLNSRQSFLGYLQFLCRAVMVT